jgi:hypothetical protein
LAYEPETMYWYGFADAGVFLYTPSNWYNSASADHSVRMQARAPASAAGRVLASPGHIVRVGCSATTATSPHTHDANGLDTQPGAAHPEQATAA